MQKSVVPSSIRIDHINNLYVEPFVGKGLGETGVCVMWLESSTAMHSRGAWDVRHVNSIIQSHWFSMWRFFKTWAAFACLMCSEFSAVRPHCMVNDTSFRKLGDCADRHQRF